MAHFMADCLKANPPYSFQTPISVEYFTNIKSRQPPLKMGVGGIFKKKLINLIHTGSASDRIKQLMM